MGHPAGNMGGQVGSQWGTWGQCGVPSVRTGVGVGSGTAGGVGAGDQHGCGTVPLPGLPAVSGRADRCPRGSTGTVVPSGLPPRRCLGVRVAVVFLYFPLEQSGYPVTSSLAFLLLQQETCWHLLGSFPALFPRQECPLTQAPHPLGWNTQVGLSFTSGPDDLLEPGPALLGPAVAHPGPSYKHSSSACLRVSPSRSPPQWVGLARCQQSSPAAHTARPQAHSRPGPFLSHLGESPPALPNFLNVPLLSQPGWILTCSIHPCSSYLCSQSRTVL